MRLILILTLSITCYASFSRIIYKSSNELLVSGNESNIIKSVDLSKIRNSNDFYILIKSKKYIEKKKLLSFVKNLFFKKNTRDYFLQKSIINKIKKLKAKSLTKKENEKILNDIMDLLSTNSLSAKKDMFCQECINTQIVLFNLSNQSKVSKFYNEMYKTSREHIIFTRRNLREYTNQLDFLGRINQKDFESIYMFTVFLRYGNHNENKLAKEILNFIFEEKNESTLKENHKLLSIFEMVYSFENKSIDNLFIIKKWIEIFNQSINIKKSNNEITLEKSFYKSFSVLYPNHKKDLETIQSEKCFFKPNNEKKCFKLIAGIFLKNSNFDKPIISMKKYEIFQIDINTYSVKWNNKLLQELLAIPSRTCNRENLRAKIIEEIQTYNEYFEIFHNNHTREILHNIIIKKLNEKLLSSLGATKVKIETKGKYPFVEKISIELINTCGIKINFNLDDSNLKLKFKNL